MSDQIRSEARLTLKQEEQVLRSEIDRMEKMEVGSTVHLGRHTVVSRDDLLAAYRRRLRNVLDGHGNQIDQIDQVHCSYDPAAGKDASVTLLTTGCVKVTPAIAEAILDAEQGTLKRIREMIEGLPQDEADTFLRELVKLAAMHRYANMPSEDYHKAAQRARLESLAERGLIAGVTPGVGGIPGTPRPPERVKTSKLERKLSRRRR